MKAIILLNGEPFRGEIDTSGAYVYCCDGAYSWANGRVKIDETLGDFDSLNELPDPPPQEVYPSEKNMTDGEIALFRTIEAGAQEIYIYGGGGKREDHFLGNLHLLHAAFLRGIPAYLITNYARIFEGAGKIPLNGYKGRTISLVPFGGDAHMISSKGLKYPLQDLTLRYGSSRGISNLAVSDEAGVTASRGRVLVFVNFPKELA